MLDWILIGGGLHGVHIAARLRGELGVSPDGLAIVDPGERLMARWRENTRNVGMQHLRSPFVHHLDLEPFSLRRFIDSQPHGEVPPYVPPYDRPALHLFDAHCDAVVERYALDSSHIRSYAEHVELGPHGVRVRTADGMWSARHLVLAMGVSEHPCWLPWAAALRVQVPDRVAHLFEQGTSVGELARLGRGHVAVIGGGVSAAQSALALLTWGASSVHLIRRHEARVHDFDSDPAWLGPKAMARFDRLTSSVARRDAITRARHRGSMPSDVSRALSAAAEQGRLRVQRAEVHVARAHEAGISLTWPDGGVEVDAVLLATGFASGCPSEGLIGPMARRAGLRRAPCGTPLVGRDLRWHPRVFVSGPLAELELGPTARNISGARRAAERIIRAARATRLAA